MQTKYTLSQNQNHPDSTTISQIQLILHLDSELYDISNGKHSVLQKQLKPKPRNKTQTQTHSHSLSLSKKQKYFYLYFYSHNSIT